MFSRFKFTFQVTRLIKRLTDLRLHLVMKVKPFHGRQCSAYIKVDFKKKLPFSFTVVDKPRDRHWKAGESWSPDLTTVKLN